MNEKITLQDLINLFSEKQGMNKKDAELFVRSMFDLIEEALATEKYVKVKGLGTFKLTEVDSRESVNVNTGERIEIQGHTKVSFTSDTTMKDLINKPFAHFETVVLNDGVELEDTPIETPETPEQEEVVQEIKTEEVPIIEETQPEPIIEIPSNIEESTEEPMVEESVAEELVIEEPITEEPTAEEPIVEEPTMEEPIEEEPVEEEPTPIVETVIQEETSEETTMEEEPQPEPIQPPMKEKKEATTNRILWGIIVVLVLIILFGAYWIFLRPSDAPEPVSTPPVQEEVTIPTPIAEEKPQEDTLKTIQFIKLTDEELRKERVPSFADTLDCQIIGTQEEYTLQKGETIIRASVRFFGTKKYWPYIVKHNMDVLKDPDNIPAGIRINIPKLVEKKSIER